MNTLQYLDLKNNIRKYLINTFVTLNVPTIDIDRYLEYWASICTLDDFTDIAISRFNENKCGWFGCNITIDKKQRLDNLWYMKLLKSDSSHIIKCFHSNQCIDTFIAAKNKIQQMQINGTKSMKETLEDIIGNTYIEQNKYIADTNLELSDNRDLTIHEKNYQLERTIKNNLTEFSNIITENIQHKQPIYNHDSYEKYTSSEQALANEAMFQNSNFILNNRTLTIYEHKQKERSDNLTINKLATAINRTVVKKTSNKLLKNKILHDEYTTNTSDDDNISLDCFKYANELNDFNAELNEKIY